MVQIALALVSSLIVSLFSIATCFAADYAVFGVKFPVDDLVSVDDANVKLSVGGQVQIIPKTRIEEVVVQNYFDATKQRSSSLSPEELWTFITNGAKKHRYDLSVLAFPEYLANADQARTDQVVAELVALDIAAGTGRALAGSANLALAQKIPARAVARLTLHAGLADPEWLRTRGVSTVFRFAPDVKNAANDELLVLLTARDLKTAQQLVGLMELLYGVDDPQVVKIRATLSRATQVFEAAASGDIDRLYTIIESSADGGGLKAGAEFAVLAPVIIDAMHAGAERALNAGKAGDALVILTHVDFDRRTDSTHRLVLRALNELVPSSPSVLTNPSVYRFLRKMAQKDGGIVNAYAGTIEREAQYLVAKGLGGEVTALLQDLVAVRPDPNAENDRIRIALAMDLERMGDARLAAALQGDVKTGVPFSAKAKLILVRILNDSSLFIILFAMIFAAVVLWRGREVRRRWIAALAERLVRTPPPEEPEEPEVEDDRIRPAGFSMLARAKGMSPSMQEYLFLLQGFGLTAEADLGNIKKAYRHAVKECHPDSNKSNDALASEKFIKLTKAYDRLLELRQAQGLDA